jgi:hypothetical protein
MLRDKEIYWGLNFALKSGNKIFAGEYHSLNKPFKAHDKLS